MKSNTKISHMISKSIFENMIKSINKLGISGELIPLGCTNFGNFKTYDTKLFAKNRKEYYFNLYVPKKKQKSGTKAHFELVEKE